MNAEPPHGDTGWLGTMKNPMGANAIAVTACIGFVVANETSPRNAAPSNIPHDGRSPGFERDQGTPSSADPM
jgi:hypothetical protein